MEYILNLINGYYIEIIVIIAAAIGLLFAYKAGNKQVVKQIILNLVVEAEKQLGSGTGELKYTRVVEKLYEVLPTLLRILYSKEEIDNLIEDAVEYLKRYLAEDKNLLSYDSENSFKNEIVG